MATEKVLCVHRWRVVASIDGGFVAMQRGCGLLHGQLCDGPYVPPYCSVYHKSVSRDNLKRDVLRMVCPSIQGFVLLKAKLFVPQGQNNILSLGATESEAQDGA
mgnify:CR=1 FL=1